MPPYTPRPSPQGYLLVTLHRTHHPLPQLQTSSLTLHEHSPSCQAPSSLLTPSPTAVPTVEARNPSLQTQFSPLPALSLHGTGGETGPKSRAWVVSFPILHAPAELGVFQKASAL